VEEAIYDGSVITDIKAALEKNHDKVNSALNALEKGAAPPASSNNDPLVDDEDRVHFGTMIPLDECVVLNDDEGDWDVMSEMIMQDAFDEEAVVIAYYTVTAKYGDKDPADRMKFSLKLFADDIEQLDTRVTVGNFQKFSVSSAFATDFDKSMHSVTAQYASLGKVPDVCPQDTNLQVISLEWLTFDKDLDLYKYIQAKTITIPSSDQFSDLPAQVKFETTEKSTKFLAFYTLSCKTDRLLAIRIKSNQ